MMQMQSKKSEYSPLISCLCVTENRMAFIPWLLWNYDKQSWQNRELVIVDSSMEPLTLPERKDVRVIHVPAGTNIASKRNMAIELAKGEIISWFDDDDWQHPHKLSILVSNLQEGAVFAGNKGGWFLNLLSGKCRKYHGINGRVVFNSAGFVCDNIKAIRFPEKVHKASDTRWLTHVQKAFPRSVRMITDQVLFFWLSHEENISNHAGRHQFALSVDRLKKNIGADAWADTDVALQSLLTRISAPEKTGLAPSAINNHPVPKPHTEKVSACLISWKRRENMQAIVNHLECFDFINEIIVWNNDSSTKLALNGNKTRVINGTENQICYARFLCARKAKNTVIYVQDDDALPDNIPAMYQSFVRNPTRIVHTLSSVHFARKERSRYGQAFNALLGWGAFFKQEWLKVFDQYIREYGEDYLLYREADKLFSVLLARQHETYKATIKMLPGYASNRVALYRDPAHEQHKAMAVSRALRLLRKQSTVDYSVTWNIVITCRNYGKYLEECVDSVLLNDADYCITLVDDASTDNTQKIAQTYADKYQHFNYLRLQEQKGVGFARNFGVSSKNSVFVVLLDADDKIGPDYLYEAEKLLKAGCDVANPDAILFGASNSRWHVPLRANYQMLMRKNCVHCCAAFRRSYWEQVRGVDETMVNWQDYDFWVKVARQGARISKLAGDHFFYRKHGESKSSISEQRKHELKKMIYNRHI